MFQRLGECKHDTHVCSCFKGEQRLCIIQSDTGGWHFGPGNWSRNCPQMRPCQSLKPIAAVLSTLFANTLLSPQSASSCEVRRLFPLSLLNRSHETVHHVAQDALKRKWWQVSHVCTCHLFDPGKRLVRWENIYSVHTGWRLLLSWPNLMFI